MDVIYLHGSQNEVKVDMREALQLSLVRATDGTTKYIANVKVDAEACRTGLVKLDLAPTRVEEEDWS